jgi:uncharacterized protein
MITKAQIQSLTTKIAEAFDPEKIILFGSYAWGEPNEDSDVGIMVVKETDDARAMARKIDGSIYPRLFPIDLFVQTPDELERKITVDRNLFLEDIVTKGTTLYANP